MRSWMSTKAGSGGVGGVISLRKETLGLEMGTDALEALERLLSSVVMVMDGFLSVAIDWSCVLCINRVLSIHIDCCWRSDGKL
jgi:hypothetical protein